MDLEEKYLSKGEHLDEQLRQNSFRRIRSIKKFMLYIQHWKFKPGYHQKGAEKFLASGAPYAGAEMLGRYHAPGSLEGWILVKAEDPKALYEHAAEWAEYLDWETTPVFTDEEAGPICAKIYG